MTEISVDLNAVGARQRQRLADALYEVDALQVALEDARTELAEVKAENEQLRTGDDPRS